MINKTFDEIQAADLEALVANEVSEGRTLDYKQQLPGSSDADKREFLADVSSFANAGGGDLLFGVPERRDSDGKTTGIPAAIRGLASVNLDQEIRRLDSSIRTGIEPTIIGVRVRAVEEGFPEGPVLVVRIPKSWAAPHMVTYQGGCSFYTRDARGKHRMDVHEIRHAFALTETLSEKIRRFRDERLARIVAGETPTALPNRPKLVLHLLPVSALDHATPIDLSAVEARPQEFKPLCASGWSPRYNFDGYLFHASASDAGSTSYVQIFRTGALEAVEATMLRPHEGRNLIPSVRYERESIEGARRYLRGMKNLCVQPPVFLLVSLLGVKGYTMAVDRRQWLGPDAHPIDRDDLILPDVIVEDFRVDVARLLRPVFDAAWQASGFPASQNYNDNGEWIDR